MKKLDTDLCARRNSVLGGERAHKSPRFLEPRTVINVKLFHNGLYHVLYAGPFDVLWSKCIISAIVQKFLFTYTNGSSIKTNIVLVQPRENGPLKNICDERALGENSQNDGRLLVSGISVNRRRGNCPPEKKLNASPTIFGINQTFF